MPDRMRTAGQPRSDLQVNIRSDNAFGHDVDAGRLAARERMVDRTGKVARMFHEFSVSAERRHDKVVTRPGKAAIVHPVRAVCSELKLALGVPAGVVADHGDKGQVAPDGGLEFCKMKTDRAVAEHGKYRRFRFDVPR